MPSSPLRIAHRGASRECRENSLPAFARALDLGADGIELDVHCTRDGIVVVHHDSMLPTDPRYGPASGRALRDVASSELRQVDDPMLALPTLDETLDLVGDRAETFVELKGTAIERDVVACIRRHRGSHAVHAFDHAAIERVAAAAPDIRRGLLFDASPRDLEATVRRTGARDLWPRHDLASAALIGQARTLGLRVIVWTVNDPTAIAGLVAAGVDGLCSDDVRLLPARDR